jgi:glycosyltransferase involved in cell wall biosynthesis
VKPRTLLLVTYHFPPSAASGSFRLLGFARHLLTNGWRMVVVAPPSLPFEPVDEMLRRKVPPDTMMVPVPYPRGNRLTRRLAPNGIWVLPAFRAAARVIRAERPDALLTSSPPHTVHLLGHWIKTRFGLPWVADYRDPWVYGRGGPKPTTWHARWEGFKEKKVLQSADGIVVNTPLAQEALLQELPCIGDKTIAITNGFDPEDFIAESAIEATSPSLTMLHSGELYSGRDPRSFFDALVGLNVPLNVPPFKVTFLGQSSDPRYDWPGEVRRRGVEKMVQFKGHVSYSEALTNMKSADILLLLDSPGRRVGIPAKLFEYFGAGRPILALAEPSGDVGWALRRSGVLHRIALPTDAGQIRQALNELIQDVSLNKNLATRMESKEFTRAHMAAQLAGFLDKWTQPR